MRALTAKSKPANGNPSAGLLFTYASSQLAAAITARLSTMPIGALI